MLHDSQSGSKVWEAPDREIGKPGGESRKSSPADCAGRCRIRTGARSAARTTIGPGPDRTGPRNPCACRRLQRPDRCVWLDPIQTRLTRAPGALTSRSNVFVSKSGCTSIRRPPGSTTASPKVASCCVGDCLAASSTFTNRPAEETGVRLLFQRRFFRWRSSVLKLKPRLRQNSLRRIPLLVNSATNS
jgi:hypothetical protein